MPIRRNSRANSLIVPGPNKVRGNSSMAVISSSSKRIGADDELREAAQIVLQLATFLYDLKTF